MSFDEGSTAMSEEAYYAIFGDRMSVDESISKKMGWWSPEGYDAYPERTEKVKQIVVAELEELLRHTRTVNVEWQAVDPIEMVKRETIDQRIEELSALRGRSE